MHFENTGKVLIAELITKKDKVILKLSNGESLEINEDIVLDYFLYVNKELTVKELQEIKESAQTSSALNAAYSLLSRSQYTKKEIRQRLQKKNYKDKIVDKVIQKLLNLGYLNDKEYVKDYLLYAQGKGPRKIKSELIKKGISDNLIKEIDFDNQDLEIAKQIDKTILKYQIYNYRTKFTKIYNHMVLLGFDAEKVKDILETKLMMDEDQEEDILRQEISKLINKLERKYKANELKKATIAYLMKKGYKYDTIYKVLKEYDFHED